MTSENRRIQIEEILNNNTEPITATALAKKMTVSRQVIVGDIALMRAAGLKISATPRGYVIDREDESQCVFTIACQHNDEHMKTELYAVVDNGGRVHDVTVEHPIYGEISGELHLKSRYDVDLFLFYPKGEFMDLIPKEVNLLDVPEDFNSFILNPKESLKQLIKRGKFKIFIYKIIWVVNLFFNKFIYLSEALQSIIVPPLSRYNSGNGHS